MARNEGRRRLVIDSAIAVLAAAGGRGLTFRAVDRHGGLPVGTTSNYFRAHADLVAAVAERIFARLAPSEALIAGFAGRTPDAELYADYVRDIVRRLLADREASLAWFELRLHGARDAELGAQLEAWRARGREADAAFAGEAGLPGGGHEVRLLHFAVDGLVFELLTTPGLAPAGDGPSNTDALVADLVARLLRT